jgi:hypothetical protein
MNQKGTFGMSSGSEEFESEDKPKKINFEFGASSSKKGRREVLSKILKRRERQERKQQQMADEEMDINLIRFEVESESLYSEEEERDRVVIFKSMEEGRTKEERDEMIWRRIRIGGYKRHKLFRKRLSHKLKGRKEDEKDRLILEYGKREILDERNASIKARVELLVMPLLEKSGEDLTDEEKQEKIDKVVQNIMTFIQSETSDGIKIAELLEEFNVLDEKVKKELRGRFLACFTDVIEISPDDKTTYALIDLLLEGISSDIEVARKSLDEYESHYALMWKLGEEGVSEETWEKELKKAMQVEEEKEKEVEYEAALPQFYTPPSDTEIISFGSVKAMGNRMGVHIEQVSSPQAKGVEGDVYEISFPMLKRAAGYHPWLRIDKRGSENMSDWRFYIERPFVDAESAKGKPIGTREYTTVEYNVQQVPYALNLMAFEYILNREIKFENVPQEDVSANDILKDADLAYIAQRLCPNVKIDQEPIQKNDMTVFRNAIIILFKRDEGAGGNRELAITERIKRFKEMLRDDVLRERIVEILSKDSSRIYTFSGFTALVERKGREEEEI